MSVSKQKLADMVLQKMKQKKQLQQKNRPHPQLLQLNIQFSLQQNQSLKSSIQQLTQILNKQTNQLNQLKSNLQELQNTGKQVYPVIIIKPQFIASQNIPISYKQFYRKTANTFLKTDIIKAQQYNIYVDKQKQINNISNSINEQQNNLNNLSIKNTKIMQDKRSKVLKQDVKRRLLIIQQQNILLQMNILQKENQSLLKQYQIKKQNLLNRINYSENLILNIQQQKHQIQLKYNPTTYRQYLKDVFNIRIKNQQMEKNLIQVIKSLNNAKKTSEKYKQRLANRFSIGFIGKTTDSPSKLKGKIQKLLSKEQDKITKTNPKNLTQLINLKSTHQNTTSKSRKIQTSVNEDLQGSRCMSLMAKKGRQTQRNYSSMKMLKSAFKSSIKSERTLSTTLAMSSAKKRFNDF